MTLKLSYLIISFVSMNLLNASCMQLDSLKTYYIKPSEKIKGTILRLDKFPSKFVTPRNVDIWFPKEYDKNKSYGVLYVHDGQMLFDADKTWNGQEWGVDEQMSALLKNSKIKETIVVGIWNIYLERNANYFPQKVFDQLDEKDKEALQRMTSKKNQVSFINSDDYLKFIVTELKPYIDANFQTKSNPENTAIMGSSRGGLISLYAICEYPEVFGAAACLSTHWIGTYSNTKSNKIPYVLFDYMMENLPSPKNHRIYFDYGTKTLDALYLPYQDLVTTVLEYKSYDDDSMMNIKFDDHEHAETFWNKRLSTPLTFLLKTTDE
jgi:enterochelin esterase-like enzyme